MISVSLGGRTYGYHLPNGMMPMSPAPVVLVLHALGINGTLMEKATQFSDLADSEGFIAVYPEGTEQPNTMITNFPAKIQMWSSGGIANINGVDDVAFLASVLSDLSAKVNTDPKKTYVVGMSNGGMMAYCAAAALSSSFAAMASVAGTITTPQWTPTTTKMPVLHIHGTGDQIITYAANEWHPSVEDVIKICSTFNKCAVIPNKRTLTQATNPLPAEVWEYSAGLPGAEVILYRILGGGHTWPQQANIPGLPPNLGPISGSINATRVIWDFLKQY